MNNTSYSFLNSLMPSEMAYQAEELGVKKATLDWLSLICLSVLAGAFIALGSIFYTSVTAGLAGVIPYGLIKLIGGLVFCLGLILVVVAGAELFTGNALVVIALAAKKITIGQLIRNWRIVFVGNFIGALGTVFLVFFSGQYLFNDGQIGQHMLEIANAKCQLGFSQAIFLGILCNALVCLAVWLCLSARTTTDKILAIIFPITAFVAAGFEHSIANMYFVPAGLMVKSFALPEFWETIGATAADFDQLTWGNFLVDNLLPVTIGNIIGGGLFVGLIYWLIYRRPGRY